MITATKRTRKDFRDRNYLIAIEIVITDLQVLETCFSCLKKKLHNSFINIFFICTSIMK